MYRNLLTASTCLQQREGINDGELLHPRTCCWHSIPQKLFGPAGKSQPWIHCRLQGGVISPSYPLNLSCRCSFWVGAGSLMPVYPPVTSPALFFFFKSTSVAKSPGSDIFFFMLEAALYLQSRLYRSGSWGGPPVFSTPPNTSLFCCLFLLKVIWHFSKAEPSIQQEFIIIILWLLILVVVVVVVVRQQRKTDTYSYSRLSVYSGAGYLSLFQISFLPGL